MKEKLKQINKVTISVIVLTIAIVAAVIIGTATYGAGDENYGNSDIGSGKLYFVSNNKEITSTPINETVSLHVNIGLAAGATANKDYLIKLNNSKFIINGLEEDNNSITFDSNGNKIVCTVHYNSDGTYDVIVSGWKDGTTLDFDLTGEMKEKGDVVATMNTSQDVYGGQLVANLIGYGDNEISYTNSKSVNYNKLSISSDGTEIKDEGGNSLVTNGGVLEYTLKGNLISNPDNETLTSISVEDTLMIPSGINISDIDTLKQYLTFSGIDENDINVSVGTTDGSYIRTVKIKYLLDTANEINNFLYSQNNKMKFDIVGAIKDCGTSIAKGSTLTITNDLQTSYTATYHSGTADKVTVNTEITKDGGVKFEFDKTINYVESQKGTYNNGEGYVIQGDKVIYYMTIENKGTDAGDVTFYDNAPWGTEITSVSIISSTGASNVQWQQSASNTNKAEGSAHIEAGGRVVVAMAINITADTTRLIRNDLYSNGSSVAYADIEQKKRVDLSISKTADKWTAEPGDAVTYTITVTNNGVDSITTDVVDYIPDGITITDPNGGTLTSETNENGESVPIVAWRDVTIGAGQTITYTLLATINSDAKGSIKNQVVVDKDGENEKWANVTIEVKDPENQTRLTKLVNGQSKIEANNGDSIEYTIQLRNHGDEYNLDDIGGSIVVTDEIPQEIEWDLNNVYYVVNGTRYTANIVRDGNTLTWTVDSIGSNGKVFPQWGEITLHIPGTINVGDIIEDKTITNTAISRTINKESTAIIIVKAPRDVQLEKYVYKIYDENDNLLYTNTTGGKVSSIDIPVRENYTVVYRLKIKNLGTTTVNKLVLTEQAVYPNGVDQQLFINNYYYTNIDTSDTNIVQPTDANIIFIKQYNSAGGYDGYFTTPVIYWWGNTPITTEDYTNNVYVGYTKHYSDNLGSFSLEPDQELTWEYSFKTTNTTFKQVTNKITNTDDKKEYTSETLYAPKKVKSLDKKVALTDIDNITINNNYADNLNLLYNDMNGKYLIYKVSIATEGYVNDVLNITDTFGNNNLSYVTSGDDANLPIVKIMKSTEESREDAVDFTTYTTSVNGNNLSIALNQTEDSSNYYNLYYDIYYLVKLNDNATENIDSINTASITYKNETVSDTAEVIILKEQIYPGIKKKYQGVYYSGTSKKDETGHNPNLSDGATLGARIVWKVTLSNSEATNSKDMINYTLSDVLPTGYEYDDFYKNAEDTSAKYYPTIVIYDASGTEIKRFDAYENTFIEPTVSTITESDAEKTLLEWNFNGEEYTLKPGYKMEVLFSSKIDIATSGKFVNNSYLTIDDGFEVANVCYGDVTTFNNKQAIHDSDYVTTYSAIVTTSYKEAETLYEKRNTLYDYANSATSDKIVKGIIGEDVKYTLNIENNSADSMSKLVLIDRLPYVGDRYILTSDNTRNSAFTIKYKKTMGATLKRVNPTTGEETEVTLTEGTDFTVEFSNERDNIFNGESPDWQGGSQDASWHSGYGTDDVNIRITFRDDLYIDPEESIKIIVKASVPAGNEIEASGEENISWNNFGYCFTAVKYEDKTDVISENIVAESAPVGVWVEQQYTKLKFTKVWNDNNNLHQIRPNSIQIQLKKRAEGDTDYVAVGDPITLDRNLYESTTNPNEWGYAFEELPAYENGKKLEYTVEELNCGNNYTETSNSTTETDDGFVVVINNTEDTGKLLINKVVKYNEENITNTSNETFYFVIKTSDNKYVLHNADGNTYLESIDSIPTYGKLSEVIWELNMQEKHMIEVPNLILGKTYQVIEVTREGNVITGNNSYYDVTYSTNSSTITADQPIESVTVTNSVKTINVNFIKKWEDSNNIHGIRPILIKIQLYADGVKLGDEVEVTVQNVSNSDPNMWTYVFENLRKYDETGKEIVYTIEEVGIINNYTVGTPVVDGNTTTITNTELVGALTVTKQVINTGNDITSTADSTFYFVLEQDSNGYVSKDGSIKNQIDADCIYSIKTGPYGDEGYSKKISNLTIGATYKVIEVNQNGDVLNADNSIYQTIEYENQTIQLTTEVAANNPIAKIINTLKTTKIKITKDWIDNNNEHGLRKPVTVHLKADGVEISQQGYVLSLDNNWTVEIENLPKYREDGRTEIQYTVEEDDIPNYEKISISVRQEDDTIIYTISNRELVGGITIKKFLLNTAGDIISSNVPDEFKGPYYITVRRNDNMNYVDEFGNESAELKVIEITPNQTITIRDIALAEYTVCETDAEGNNIELDENFTSKLQVLKNNQQITINKDTNSGLAEFKNKIIGKTSIDVIKVWEDQINASYRPTEVEVTLYANSEIATDLAGNEMIYTLTEADKLENDPYTWKHTFENLPIYDDNGNRIVYTVSENFTSDFYSSSINQDTKTITNTLVERDDKVKLTITKNWDNKGNENESNFRPDSVMFIITNAATQDEVRRVTMSAEDNWKLTIVDLPKYDTALNIITYDVYEVIPETDDFKYYDVSDAIELASGLKVRKATVTNQEGDSTDYEVTNPFEIPDDKITITVNKVWDSEPDQIPDSITVTVVSTIDGNSTEQDITIKKADCTITEDGTKWEYVIRNLPKYDKVTGKEISYSVKEKTIKNYESTTIEENYSNDNKSVTFKNKLKRGELTVSKVVKNDQGTNITNTMRNTYYFVVKTGDKYVNAAGKIVDEPQIFEIATGQGESDYSITIKDLLLDKTYTVIETDSNGNKFDENTKEYVVKYNSSDSVNIIEENPRGSVEIENKLITKKIIVNKFWNDENDKYQKRPESLKLILKKNIAGTEISEEKIVNISDCVVEGNKWVYELKNLPIYDDYGNKIIYNVDEVEDFEWYYKSQPTEETLDGDSQKFTIINSEVVGNYSLELEKVDESNNSIPGIEFKIDNESFITNGSGKILIVDNKEIYDNTAETVSIEEVSYRGADSEKKYIKLKEKLTLYISKQRVDNKCKVTGVSFDNIKFGTEISKHVQLENDEEVEVIALIKDNNIIVSIPNIEQKFDLSLKKFITKVNEDELTSYAPEFVKKSDGTYTYNMDKNPVEVENNDLITYTIRVYNEGNVHGYADILEDNIPEGLEFVSDNNTNIEYKWNMLDAEGNVTYDKEKAVKIQTNYLSKENGTMKDDGKNSNLIKEFNINTMKEPDYREVKVVLKVTEPSSKDRIVENRAHIIKATDYTDEEAKDIDSTPNKWIDGDDDQDIARIKVKYFDLSLTKYITKVMVTENGVETVSETKNTAKNPDATDMPKIDLKKSKINNIIIKVEYEITVTNEGEIEGYANEIADYIPQGFKFVKEDNINWYESDGRLITNELETSLLQPGESATVKLILTWDNASDNVGLKINTAEISKDNNNSDTPDKDSTPGNKVPGEDDIDSAQLLITIKTGNIVNGIKIANYVLAVLAFTILGVQSIRARRKIK